VAGGAILSPLSKKHKRASPDPDFLARQTGFRRPEWVAQMMARGSALIVGYAGWVGDREAIEPAGGVSPLRGGAGEFLRRVIHWHLSTVLEMLDKLDKS
jgi:hypothetical protein